MGAKGKNKNDDLGLLAAAREGFQQAAAGRISPSELAAVLREVMAGGPEKSGPRKKMWAELKEFLDLDLSDFAYSLAIHDQKAIDRLKKKIEAWAERLAAEMTGR